MFLRVPFVKSNLYFWVEVPQFTATTTNFYFLHLCKPLASHRLGWARQFLTYPFTLSCPKIGLHKSVKLWKDIQKNLRQNGNRNIIVNQTCHKQDRFHPQISSSSRTSRYFSFSQILQDTVFRLTIFNPECCLTFVVINFRLKTCLSTGQVVK